MKKYLILSLLSFVSSSYADIIIDINNEVNPSCVENLKACLVEVNGRMAECLGDAGENVACEDSLLGRIAQKRSALTPTEPAFTGPSMVDKECLTNFDNKLSSALLKGAPSREEVNALNDLLSKCEDNGNVLDNFKP